MTHVLCSSATKCQIAVCTRVLKANICHKPTCFRIAKRPLRCRTMDVRAEGGFPAPKPPKGVTQPPIQPEVPPASFGFVEAAERLNSRAAMLGFFGILLVEWIAGKGVFELAGISVGNGLGFEF